MPALARAAKMKVQEEAVLPKTGNGLLTAVGLGIAFLLFMALLSVVRSGGLFTESNLLYAALIFYGAAAFYIGFGVSGTERYVKVASALVITAWVFK